MGLKSTQLALNSAEVSSKLEELLAELENTSLDQERKAAIRMEAADLIQQKLGPGYSVWWFPRGRGWRMVVEYPRRPNSSLEQGKIPF